MLKIGDLNCVYSRVLDMDMHSKIIENLKQSLVMMSKMQKFLDPMMNEDDLKAVKHIICEMLEIVEETVTEIKDDQDDFSKAWKLLRKCEIGEEIQQTVKNIFAKNFDTERYERKKLKLAERQLIKGHLLSLSANFKVQTSDTPMECASVAVQYTGQIWKLSDRNHNFDQICQMLKCFNVVSKARKFLLQNLIRVGLSKEMRAITEKNVEIGIELALLPSLCEALLLSIEVDLFCDDGKQAQVKLLEIEKLLKKELGQQKIRTKLR